jgi:thiol-disulfide isomerase/thioredoxin
MTHPRFLARGAFAAALFLTAAVCGRADGIHAKSAEPIRISHGEPVTLADYLVPGKTTIFDFYSDYCPPCRALKPKLENLHRTHPDVALVVVDINRPGTKGIDWKSPVARQFQLESIPHLAVYGPDGHLQGEGDGAESIVGRLITP